MSNHIKIQGTSPRIQYVADGNLNAYEFPFVIFNPSDINVYFNDKVQDLDTYTVAISKNTEGGEVSFETAPASGTIITIVRNLAIKRTSTFQEGGALRAKVLNNEFDYQMACQQQIADSLNRSMVLPPYAVDTDVDLTLPTPSAGKAIVWNKDGTNLENSAVKINELESTLKGYKESAESSATIATEKASIASDKADIASEKADIATEKANEAVSTLASKANTDMDNLSELGKTHITSFGMPDYSKAINKAWDTMHFSEKDGYVYIKGDCSASHSIMLCIYENEIGDSASLIPAFHYGNTSNNGFSAFVPIPKGYYYKAREAGVTNNICQFIPLKGA